MSTVDQHPAARAISAIANAAQIAVAIRDADLSFSHAQRIVELLADVPDIIVQLRLALERGDEDLRGLRDEGLVMAQEVTEARQLKAQVVELLEDAKAVALLRVGAASTEHNAFDALYKQALPPEERRYPRTTSAPHTIIEPCVAAAGR